MTRHVLTAALLVSAASLALSGAAFAQDAAATGAADLSKIDTVVYIYAENRSFDNLYGAFPGANGLANVKPADATQLDRDGKPMKELPPVWDGLTAKGVTPPITQAQTEHMPNAPFAIDDPKGYNLAPNVVTHDLWHRFYQEQMQIDGGKNDKFVAWADAGGEVMGHYDTGANQKLWKIAQQFTLADNFFQGAFGGSFLNHFWLVCACAPVYPDAATSPAKPTIAAVEQDGVTLKVADNSPKSAIDGIPKFVSDGNITPDGYAVNTMQPPYQPSANPPAAGGDPAYADPMKPTTLPPQTMTNIGDLLNQKGVSWAYWSGAWGEALAGRNTTPVPNFQYHHQPFNYFADMAPGTANRDHIKDAGLNGVEFIKAIDAGTLPRVNIYKPQGNLNQHAGYADVNSGDEHIADVISHLEKSPQWPHMLVVVSYDENGGFWDHVAPPKADRWGPGNRIPALIISPFAKKGFVDHAENDSTSPIRFVIKRFGLQNLDGLAARDKALVANGAPPMGDLTEALDFSQN
jgi:phospholipase C